ncbi:RNA-directed DNA polymerase [Verrucosispora sp. SN26_14.1]|uniref:reverse transcriptase family protein n=1 Tax=Verrucosispora sp. SN26_14.1 TaxID=2527879 RepID=UPI0010331589|nr:reverse transcriptase family protein [Verrucosispora sp. SN26_14.1]TBL43333.1 RNA-directed DNA polymerase [Verrucosispora sp. SN26_14.1]
MSTDSPAAYQRIGRQRGVPDVVVEAALEQIRRVRAVNLTPVLSLKHLAHLTGASYIYLRETVQRKRDPYVEFSRPKRAEGQLRTISAPDPPLMAVQRWILQRIFSRLHPHSASYAYQAGRSARQCAEQHLGARWLLKFDLHSFFHSINERAVFGILAGQGYNRLVSFEIARLCTRYAGHVRGLNFSKFRATASWPHHFTIPSYSVPWLGFLPQGAPTSGAIANMTALQLDELLSDVADRYGLVYTRYADDLTFSTVGRLARSAARRCVGEVQAATAQAGFQLHQRKTRVVPPGSRKIVLGLLVDSDCVRLPADARSRLETHVRGVARFGLVAHAQHWKYNSLTGLIHRVDGLLAHARDVDPLWVAPLWRSWNDALEAQGFSDVEFRQWS